MHPEKRYPTQETGYPFPLFFEEWGLDIRDVAFAWDNNGILQRYNPGRSTPCSLHIPNKNVPQDQMSCGTSAFLLVGTYSCAAPSAAASGRSQLVIIPPSSSKVAVFTIWDLPTRISWVPSSLDRLSFTVPSMVKTRL